MGTIHTFQTGNGINVYFWDYVIVLAVCVASGRIGRSVVVPAGVRIPNETRFN